MLPNLLINLRMLKKKLKTNKNLRRQREIYMHVLHTRLQRKTSNLQLVNSLYLCTIHFYLYREMRKKKCLILYFYLLNTGRCILFCGMSINTHLLGKPTKIQQLNYNWIKYRCITRTRSIIGKAASSSMGPK